MGMRTTVWLIGLVVGCFMIIGQADGSETQGAKLIGIWGSEQVLGPRVRGELIIDARGPGWKARIAGMEAPVDHSSDEVRFSLPDGLGEFRGWLSKDARSITGHWIQPAGNMFSQRYATPVLLNMACRSAWTGRVEPLEERVSLYLSIQTATNGGLKAIFRNPEFGAFSNGTWHVAQKEKGKVQIVGDQDGFTIPATYDAQADRLLLSLPETVPPVVVLTRRTDATATGYSPRSPREESYTYHQPIAENDGWATASLQEVGIDPKPIAALIQSILTADPADGKTFSIHSLLIARHGKLVLEEYFRGFDRERPHDMRSAGKTFAPMLIGVARYHGAKIDPSTPVYSLFPEYKPFANPDDRKSKLTLQDLMTMTPGLASDDNDDSSPGGEDRMQSQKEQPDWYRYTLDLPMVRDPGGTAAIYSSASLNLVGGIAEKASGIWNAELFHRDIAMPLQFGAYHLNLMPTGSVYTGGGAYLRPRDELKLGQVYLSGGIWNGRRVLSREWVEQSTAYHATFAKPIIDIDTDHRYGYGWHLYRFPVNGHVYHVYAAGGNGGQWVIVLPDLDMVVGVNGGSYRNADVWYRWGLEVIPRYLIPAGASGL